MISDAERRLLRFLQTSKTAWTDAKVIRNTEELLPGDEKVLRGLVSRGLVLPHFSDDAFRMSETGASELLRSRGKDG
jgi:hypothetical protein